MKVESDKIQKQENNPDDLSAVTNYNQEFGQYRNNNYHKYKIKE